MRYDSVSGVKLVVAKLLHPIIKGHTFSRNVIN